MNPEAIRDKVAIVGMGCSKFGENWDKDPQDMIVEAAYEAYEDAGLEDPHKQIEAVFCGAQYPFQRVCYRCYAKDDFDKVRLSDRLGTLKSFTFDYFAGSPDPPLIATVTDVEGARLYLQMTDASPKEVKLDLPVELTFRRIHEAGGTPNYYWKCTPVRRGAE